MQKMTISCILAAVMSLGLAAGASAENQPSTMQKVQEQAGQAMNTVAEKAGELGTQVKTQAGQVMNKMAEQADEAKNAVEHSEQAKKLTAGLLQWIYVVAQALAFPAFYWLAFALMVAGVVSWAGQLVIGKLVVATAGGFSITEIISDTTVLAISLVGLVLTTQAATQNSTFTQSPVMVLSSAGVGIIFGIMLYFWGQAQEVEAAHARDARANSPKKR